MAARDLTTLEDVREHLQLDPAVETEQDEVIAPLITAYSSLIHDHCQREFTPASDSTTRLVEFDLGGELQSLAPFDCRTATLVVLDAGLITEQTLSADQWRLALLDHRNSVWTGLQLYNVAIPYLGGRTLTVTGTWGYAQIPDHVSEACILAVLAALRGEIQSFGGPLQPNSFGDGANDAQALPPGVRGLLTSEVRTFYR